VISYGVLNARSPRRLHRLFALEAFLGGVAPWPASDETFELLPLLKLPGDIPSYRFADWRNQAVRLSHPRCAAAIYSRPGEAWLLLANLDQDPHEVTCGLDPAKLPHPLDRPATAVRWDLSAARSGKPSPGDASKLNAAELTGAGTKVVLPGDGALMIQVR
jgi:hypothetical protein